MSVLYINWYVTFTVVSIIPTTILVEEMRFSFYLVQLTQLLAANPLQNLYGAFGFDPGFDLNTHQDLSQKLNILFLFEIGFSTTTGFTGARQCSLQTSYPV